jgi:predicted N-acetyltransferase YhbS
MLIKYKIVELGDEIVSVDMLDKFERRQVVNQRYCMNNGIKELEEIYFIEDWTKEERHQIVTNYIKDANKKSLYASAVYIENEIAGFMVLDYTPVGPNNEYAELKQLHVSQKYRKKGIGKALFYDAVKKANELRFSKLYISAYPAYETQIFYELLGCTNSVWLDPKALELEPYDIQMEYVLT